MAPDTNHTETVPDLPLQQLIRHIRNTKEELTTLRDPTTLLTTPRHQLQGWHAQRMAAAAQERERYGRNDMPYT